MITSKTNTRSQLITLEEYLKPTRSKIRMKATGAYFISWGVMAVFWWADLIPYQIGQVISFVWAGWYLISGSEEISAQIKYWSDNVQVFDQSAESEDSESANTASLEDSILIDLRTDDNRPVTQLTITIRQLRDMARVYRVGGTLHRSDLDKDVWANLSRTWHNGHIKGLFRSAGLIDINGKFISISGGGVADTGYTPNNDTHSRVGGSV